MKTLFDIMSDHLALNDLLDEIGGELADPRAEEAWMAMASELATDEGIKLDSIIGLIKTWEAEAVAARAEAEQWHAKAISRENRIKWQKLRLLNYIQGTGREKVQTAKGRILAIAKNGGLLPLILPDPLDPAAIPDEFAIVRRDPDREAIRRALADGVELPFARLGEQGVHLRVR